MFALSTTLLRERGQWKDLPELARDSMEIFRAGYAGADVRLDAAYQACLPEFATRRDALRPADVPDAFRALFAEGSRERV